MCGKLESNWIAYLDGKVSAQERAAVEAHLAACPECARRHQEFLAVFRALGEWEAPEPSPWFDARLRRRIAEDHRRLSWFPRLSELLPPVPVAVGALVLLACLLISSGDRTTVKPQPATMISDRHMEEVYHAVEEVDLLNNFELLSELKKPAMPREGERH